MASTPPLAPGRQPVIGHTRALLEGPLDALQRWGQTDEEVVRLQLPGRELCLVTQPEAIKQILNTNHTDFRKAEIVRDRLGTLQGGSLVLLEDSQWQQRRERLQPAFGRGRVAATGSLTTEHTSETVAGWSTEDPILVVSEARKLVVSILSEALFGLDSGAVTPIQEAADDILARMDPGSVSAYLPEWVPTPTNIRFRRAVSTLHERLDRVVDRHHEQSVAGRSTDSLLSIMLAADLPPETVRDELIALLFAGYDSTATALSCTLGLLAAHPTIQSELRGELNTVVGDQPPTPEDLPKLPLLDTVITESLRLYPPQYVLFREPTTPVTLAGYRIEPRTTLVIPPWVLHRDRRYWNEPSTFHPGRWRDGSGTDERRPKYAYFPYGGGPRYCLGSGLADQILRLIVAEICRRRQLRSTDSLSVSAGPTLSVDEELQFRTTRR